MTLDSMSCSWIEVWLRVCSDCSSLSQVTDEAEIGMAASKVHRNRRTSFNSSWLVGGYALMSSMKEMFLPRRPGYLSSFGYSLHVDAQMAREGSNW